MSDEDVREQDVPEGSISSEDLVQEPVNEDDSSESEESSAVTKMDISEVALEVRKGEWGKGQERRRRLSEAGYDVREVEAEVTRQLNS